MKPKQKTTLQNLFLKAQTLCDETRLSITATIESVESLCETIDNDLTDLGGYPYFVTAFCPHLPQKQ